jgi:hypothetical protein
MELEDVYERLKAHVLDNKKPASYKWVCFELDLPMNFSKK